MTDRGFVSCFAEDLNKMIDLLVAAGGAEGTYLPRAKSFDRFCAEKPLLNGELTEALSQEWLEPIMKEKPQVIHNRIAFLDGFAAYLKSMGKPATTLHNRFAAGRSFFVPYLFSDDELARIFRVIDANKELGTPFQQMMFSVYFRLVYTCGLRPGESVRLKRKDVNLQTGEILIELSKGHKSRIVVMSDDMCALATKYKALLDISYPNTEYFFPGKKATKSDLRFYSKCFRLFWAAANPDIAPEFLPRVRIYDLRHRFATAAIHRWLDRGEDINAKLPYLQMYMGHKDVSHTAYYIHLLPENLIRSKGVDWESLNAVFPGVELWQD